MHNPPWYRRPTAADALKSQWYRLACSCGGRVAEVGVMCGHWSDPRSHLQLRATPFSYHSWRQGAVQGRAWRHSSLRAYRDVRLAWTCIVGKRVWSRGQKSVALSRTLVQLRRSLAVTSSAPLSRTRPLCTWPRAHVRSVGAVNPTSCLVMSALCIAVVVEDAGNSCKRWCRPVPTATNGRQITMCPTLTLILIAVPLS